MDNFENNEGQSLYEKDAIIAIEKLKTLLTKVDKHSDYGSFDKEIVSIYEIHNECRSMKLYFELSKYIGSFKIMNREGIDEYIYGITEIYDVREGKIGVEISKFFQNIKIMEDNYYVLRDNEYLEVVTKDTVVQFIKYMIYKLEGNLKSIK